MIDEKINKSLFEIEKELRTLNSARNQVDAIVKTNEELSKVASSYVSSMNALTREVTELVKSIESDYLKRISELKKQQDVVQDTTINTLNAVTEATNKVIQIVQKTVRSLQTISTIGIVLNVVIIIILMVFNILK